MKALLAIDDTATAQSIVEFLLKQQWLRGAEMRILSVVPPVEVMMPFGPLPTFSEDTYAALTEHAHRVIEFTAKGLREEGFRDLEWDVQFGDPAFCISGYVKKWKPDLLIVGKHQKSKLDKFLLGSTSEQLAEMANCSVLVLQIPERAAIV
jgi:nucleotide-binding universal stress UspA family protein